MKTSIIINPKAGRGLSPEGQSSLKETLREHFPEARLLETQCAGDEVRLGRECSTDGTELLLSVGGDGTLNGVVNGLMNSGRTATELPILVPIPRGTGGDFARGLGYPAQTDAVLGMLPRYDPMPVDIGVLDFEESPRRYWINQSYVGLGARVVERVNRSQRRSGRRAYTMASLAEAMHVRCISATLDLPFRKEPVEFVNILLANGTHSGGGMHTAPGAQLDDGLFELIVVSREAIRGAFPRIKILKNLSRFKDGSYIRLPGVHRERTQSLNIRGARGDIVEADGEIVGHLPVRYSLLPRGLRVLRPNSTPTTR